MVTLKPITSVVTLKTPKTFGFTNVGGFAATTAQTQATWAKLVLHDAGLPITKNNVDNIVRWMTAEEPPSNWWDRNNPLNNGLGSGGGAGLGSYSTLSVAASYVAQQLNSGTYGYTKIRAALANNAPVTTFSRAVVASTWASGHYGGNPLAIAHIAVPTLIPHLTPGGLKGLPQQGTAGAATATGPAGSTTCLIQFPGVAGVGAFCIISNEQAKRVLGGLLVVAGGLGMSLGLILLAAYGLEGTVASRIGKSLAGSVPGGNRVTAGAPAKPSGDEDDSLFESLPAATKARITAENRTQAAEESRRQPKPYESPFTTADASTPTQRPASARRRQPQRERRPRATSHR